MTREEIIEAYGLELDTVERFRAMGLITPKRMEDGALVYSDHDGEMLQRLLLLEKMGFSENDIINLRSKEKTLEALIQRQLERLEQGCLGKEICRQILEEGADLQNFDAKKYLNQLEGDTLENIFSFTGSYRNQVFRPWRRYFARMFDTCIYSLLWYPFLGYVCHVNLSDLGFLLQLVGGVIILVIMLFIEPLLLKRFGTTFGKWIFGLRVEKADGTHLTYKEGLRRTWVIIGKGFGYNIPIYNLVRQVKSYKLCKAEEIQPWDEGISYTIKDTKGYRVVAFIVLNLICFMLIFILQQAQEFPPNRGDITLEEFVENYNYFCKYIDPYEGKYLLDENGHWAGNLGEDTFLDIMGEELPTFEYEIENGNLTGVSFSYEVENKEHSTDVEKMEQLMIVLAFGCTDKEIGIFNNDMESIVTSVISDEDFDFIVGNSRYFCHVEQEGYEGVSEIIPQEDTERAYYKKVFSVTKK